ncbi:MAG: polysaccharide biosynthesis C-terminal domain-containing protein, partial [Terriglobales bacterium]
GLQAAAARFLAASAVTYGLYAACNPFWGLLIGLHRMAATHALGLVGLLLELAAILVLRPVLTLAILPWLYGGIAVLCFGLGAFFAARAFPPLRIVSPLGLRSRALGLLSFSGRMSVTNLTATLSPVIDKVIVARVLGLEIVTMYEAASRIAEIGRRLTQLLLLPVLPLAGYDLHRPVAETQSRYRKLFGFNLLLSAWIFLLPLGLAPLAFHLWLGRPAPDAARMFEWMAVAGFCLSLSSPGITTWAGADRLKLLLVSSLLGLAINLLVSPVLAMRWGLGGLLLGLFLAYGAVNLGVLVFLNRRAETQLEPLATLRLMFAVLAPSLLLTAAAEAAVSLLGKAAVPTFLFLMAGCLCAAVAGAQVLIPSTRRLMMEAVQMLR